MKTKQTPVPIRIEPCAKWIRGFFGGKCVVDSKRVQILFPGPVPFYYFPKDDVRMENLAATGRNAAAEGLGEAAVWNLSAGGKTAENAAFTFDKPSSPGLDLTGLVTFDWDTMDAWFEEADEVYVHAHSPYHRIDTLHSTRHVQVRLGGKIVADSKSPVLLFETGLPVRYYLPRLDVREELLVPSDLTTGCAYKGRAEYYSLKVGDKIFVNIAWYYRYPATEASKIAGRIAFFKERVDAIIVDGLEIPQQETQWSPPPAAGHQNRKPHVASARYSTNRRKAAAELRGRTIRMMNQ